MEKDRLDELKQYSIPTSEYWWISGPEIAISKSFFKYWSLFLASFVSISVFLALETNVWQRLFIWIFVTNWIISLPVTGIAIVIGWFMYNRRKKQNAKRRAEAIHRRKFEEATINQAGGGNRK